MKYFVSLWMPLFLYTLFFFAIPIYHQVTNRDLRPALMINLDSLSMLVGLLGIGVITAVATLHRRIAALEKASAASAQAK